MTTLKEKIIEKMKYPSLASFATVTSDYKPWTRYVVVMADNNLDIWFATRRTTRKTIQIANNPEVHLTLGVTDLAAVDTYLQIQGRAEILDDADSKKAVWYDLLEKVFKGPEDPEYCVCKITPYRIEFNTMDPAVPPEIWVA